MENKPDITNFETNLHNAVDKIRQEKLKDMPVLSLGELIAKLEAIAQTPDAKRSGGEEPWVRYDFGSAVPTTLDSWRGVYAELALGYQDDGLPELSKVIEELKSAVGKTFTGYKGGDFKMGRTTPVWVANYGDSGSTAIVDVVNRGYEVVFITKDMDV